MPHPAFAIIDAYRLEGVGVILRTDLSRDALTPVHVGEVIELALLNGGTIRTALRGIEMIEPASPHTHENTLSFLVSMRSESVESLRGATAHVTDIVGPTTEGTADEAA